MDNDVATKTPTFRKLAEHMDSAFAILNAIEANGADASFDQLRALIRVAVADTPEDTQEETLKILNQGLSDLEQLSFELPCLSVRLRLAALALVIGTIQIGTFPAGERIGQEKKKIKPILTHNNAKAAAVERSQSIATKLWQADTEQEMRLGDMAERVYRALAAEGFTDSLPGTADRIKEWIKPVAPDYARKGGRRRKTP